MCLLSSVWWHSSIVQPDTLYRTSQPPILHTFRRHNPCKRTDHLNTFQLDMLQKLSSVRFHFVLCTLEGIDLLAHQFSLADFSLSLSLSLARAFSRFPPVSQAQSLSLLITYSLMNYSSHANELGPCRSDLWLSSAHMCLCAPSFACVRTHSLPLVKFHLCTWSI